MKTEMKNQAGFTLIELIMVIVILGILAATALPKFVNLGQDARVASVKSLEGSMRAANAIIYAKANVGNLMSSATSVTINGTSIFIGYGYASTVSATDGLMGVMDVSTNDFAASGNFIVYHKGATTIGSTCGVTYAPSTGATTAPTYTLNTAGC